MPTRAFTLLELLLVMAVIAALAGIGFPIIGHFRKQASVKETSMLVRGIAARIAAEAEPVIMVQPAPGQPRQARRRFDIDGDGVLDGDPARVGGTLAAIAPAGYRGFVLDSGYNLQPKHLNERGEVVDAWKRPLRIAFAARGYDGGDLGVWSSGRDGLDAPLDAEADDVRSWR